MAGEAHLRYRWTKNKNGSLVKSAVIYTVDEHKINSNDVDPLASLICKKLNRSGYETYIVGGAVRDLLLKKTPKDFDIASTATPSKIKSCFGNSRIIGKRCRLVHIFYGEKIFEIATFRSSEGGSTGNTFGSIEDDVKRRDFTMNSLFYDPEKQIVLDYVGGYKDINNQKIRPIISLKTIFEDDPVRMIRAVKYSTLSGFTMPFFLKNKIKHSAHLLKTISASRLTEEISKIIKSPSCEDIIKNLMIMGLYVYLQPKAAYLIKSSSDFKKRYFKTLSSLKKECKNDCEEYSQTLSGGLRALVEDYINDNFDWNTANEESYKTTFLLARKFVLPMNPPRMELGKAVADIFASHNITVKRWRKFDKF
jgi:poly(A) polymerase